MCFRPPSFDDMMKTCPNCGEFAAPEDTVCKNCGEEFPAVEESAAPAAPGAPTAPGAPVPPAAPSAPRP